MGTCVKVISWNIIVQRGDVKWVLRRFACDIAPLQESKLEVVGRHIVVSSRGLSCLIGVFAISGPLGRNYHYLGPLGFWSSWTPKSGLFLCAAKFKSLHDNFV